MGYRLPMAEMTERVAEAAHEEAARYAHGAPRPLRGYAIILSTYGTAVGGLVGIARLTGRRPPDGINPWELTLLGLATHKISRLIAKDPVVSPLRAPFTRFEGTSAESELAEEVRGHGLRHAVGELVTCPFCTAPWVATGLSAGLVFSRRGTRLVAAAAAAVGISDFLQYAYAQVQQRT